MKTVPEVWSELLQKPEEDRSETEQNVVLASMFAFDFENGSWLYNLSPDGDDPHAWRKLYQTAQSVAAIGVPSVAERLQRIATIVEQGDSSQEGTWDEFMESVDPNGEIEVLESAISDDVNLIYEKLDKYTRQHFQCRENG